VRKSIAKRYYFPFLLLLFNKKLYEYLELRKIKKKEVQLCRQSDEPHSDQKVSPMYDIVSLFIGAGHNFDEITIMLSSLYI
jgi:hypothetical protein